MTYIATGNTFPHREVMKSHGGWWNPSLKRWEFEALSETSKKRLQSIPGVLITDLTPDRGPSPPPPPTIDDEPPLAPLPRKTIFIGDDPTYVDNLIDDVPRYTFGFSSMAKLCDYIETLTPRNDGMYCDVAYLPGSSVFMKKAQTDDLPHAIDIARHGWTDGLDLLQKFAVPFAENKHRFTSMAGGRVSVGKMLAGNPLHMVRRRHAPKHRNVRVFVEIGGWREQSIFCAVSRTLIVAALIDLMERQGFRCEIIAVHSSNFGTFIAEQLTVVIKAANERLNLADLTFACGHPSFALRLKNALVGSVPVGLTYQFRGYMNDTFPPGKLKENEYCFKMLWPGACLAIDACDDPMKMIPFIAPDNFPIDVKEPT